MLAPRGGESRRQEGGKGSRAGLSGAGVPPPPPPLSASSRLSSRPFPSRRCPGPFHPPIKLFFFFFQTSWEDPGWPMGGGVAGTNSGGGRGRANGSAGEARRQGLLRRDGRAGAVPGAADGGGGNGGRAGLWPRRRAGRKEGPSVQVTPLGRCAGVRGGGSGVWYPRRPATVPPRPSRQPPDGSDGSIRALPPRFDDDAGEAPNTTNSARPTRPEPFITCVVDFRP